MASDQTFSAVRDRLIANGYAPYSILAPYDDLLTALGGAGVLRPEQELKRMGHGVADEVADYAALAAILCLPPDRTRRVVSVILSTQDKALRAIVNDTLESLGLASGPVRIGSDGSERRPIRFEESYDIALTRGWSPNYSPSPALILEAGQKSYAGSPVISAIIPLFGTWSAGDLLSVPRSKLPGINLQGIDNLFIELDARNASRNDGAASAVAPSLLNRALGR